MGAMVPPLMPESLAVIMQRTPETVADAGDDAAALMFSAPSSSCMLSPASVESSRNGEPRSRRWARRWRGVSWPRFWNIGSFWFDVSRTRASNARKPSTSANMSRRLARNASEFGRSWIV